MEILLVIGVFIGFLLLRRVLSSAAGAADRAINSSAAANEDELLQTVVTFRTKSKIPEVREAVSNHVTLVKRDIIHGAMKVTYDSLKGIEWEGGSISLRNGFKAQLVFGSDKNMTTAEFFFTEHISSGGVSPYIDRMTRLRNEVITAFKSVDPSVGITKGRQDVRRKQSWF